VFVAKDHYQAVELVCKASGADVFESSDRLCRYTMLRDPYLARGLARPAFIGTCNQLCQRDAQEPGSTR
jgi:hypothetical protein